MKFLLVFLFFPIISFAQTNDSVVTIDFKTDIDRDMTNGMTETLSTCLRKGKKSCPVLLNKSTATKMQDYLMLALSLNSAVTKHGLIVSLEEVSQCMIKMEKVSKILTFRQVNPKNKTVTTSHYYSQNSDWTEACLLRLEVTLNLKDSVVYESDLVHSGSPIALSPEYWNELEYMIKMMRRETNRNHYSPGMRVLVAVPKKKKWFLGEYTSWSVEEALIPQAIHFTTR